MSRCRRSLCEIPSRTANGGRLMERARLKEPTKWQGHGNIKGRLSEAGPCDLTHARPAQSASGRAHGARDPIAPLLGEDGKADGQMCVTIP